MMSNKEARATLTWWAISMSMSSWVRWTAGRSAAEVMLQHSELRPGGSAGNCALALEAMQVRHRAVANQGDDGLSAWLASHFPHSAAHWTRYPAKPRSPLALRTPITSDRSSAISVTLCGSARWTC